MSKRTSLPLWFYLSLAVPAAAAVLTSWNLLRVMSAVRNAESSGLLAVGRGIMEANYPLLAAFYVGIASAVIAIIAHVRSSNNSSPAWLTLGATTLMLIPVMIVWLAESLMLNALPSSRDGVVANATLIQRLLFAGLGGSAILTILFLAAPTLRVTSNGAAKRTTVVTICLVITVFVLATVALQLRNNWINGLYTQF